MKYRLGKCRVKKEEFVEAKLCVPAEVVRSCCQAAIAAGVTPPSVPTTLSRLLPSPSGGGSLTAGEGGTASSATRSISVSALSCALISFTYCTCSPTPRCPPTPDFRSSSFFRIRQTSLGHLESNGRRLFPLNSVTAKIRSSWVAKLTKAQDDRDIRKTEETVKDGLKAMPSGTSSGFIGWLRNFHISSCVAATQFDQQGP